MNRGYSTIIVHKRTAQAKSDFVVFLIDLCKENVFDGIKFPVGKLSSAETIPDSGMGWRESVYLYRGNHQKTSTEKSERLYPYGWL